jgi:hypothetical protein
MSYLLNFQSDWSRDALCMHTCASLTKGQFMRIYLEKLEVNFEIVSKAGKRLKLCMQRFDIVRI